MAIACCRGWELRAHPPNAVILFASTALTVVTLVAAFSREIGGMKMSERHSLVFTPLSPHVATYTLMTLFLVRIAVFCVASALTHTSWLVALAFVVVTSLHVAFTVTFTEGVLVGALVCAVLLWITLETMLSIICHGGTGFEDGSRVSASPGDAALRASVLFGYGQWGMASSIAGYATWMMYVIATTILEFVVHESPTNEYIVGASVTLVVCISVIIAYHGVMSHTFSRLTTAIWSVGLILARQMEDGPPDIRVGLAVSMTALIGALLFNSTVYVFSQCTTSEAGSEKEARKLQLLWDGNILERFQKLVDKRSG